METKDDAMHDERVCTLIPLQSDVTDYLKYNHDHVKSNFSKRICA